MGVFVTEQPGLYPESVLELPWAIDPEASWLAYALWVEVLLDPGLVKHKQLPSRADPYDSLASVAVGDPKFGQRTTGVNLGSQSTGASVIQRMASSEYRFTLKGYGRRAGYPVPVPGLVTVGGQPAVPDAPQWSSGNVLVGNLPGGIPVFHCLWSLPYLVQGPLARSAREVTLFNPALHIRSDAQLPVSVALPRAPLDPRVRTGADVQPPDLGTFGAVPAPPLTIGPQGVTHK